MEGRALLFGDHLGRLQHDSQGRRLPAPAPERQHAPEDMPRPRASRQLRRLNPAAQQLRQRLPEQRRRRGLQILRGRRKLVPPTATQHAPA